MRQISREDDGQDGLEGVQYRDYAPQVETVEERRGDIAVSAGGRLVTVAVVVLGAER